MGFFFIQEATEKEAALDSSEYSMIQRDESSTSADKETISLSAESSSINLNVENSGSAPQVVLSVPGTEEILHVGYAYTDTAHV